jgi:hypothetical protein
MRDDTGKWLTAADLIRILQQLPPGVRIYPNDLGELSVIDDSNGKMQLIGMIDFNFGEYESYQSFLEEQTDA